MPWRNGQGTTVEIAKAPREGSFDWRVSIADVAADGPFSRFDGYDRSITAIDGAGMILRSGTREARIGRLDPYRFSGDDNIECFLIDGRVRDFNVMTLRHRWRSVVEVEHLAAGVELTVPMTLLYVVEGRVETSSSFAPIKAGETLLLEECADQTITAHERSIVITVALTRNDRP